MSDGAKLYGQLFNTDKGTKIPFTERQHGYSGEDTARVTGLEGQANTEQIPTDRDAAKVRVFDVDAFVAANKTEYSRYDTKINLTREDIPLVLTAVAVRWNVSEGAGTASHPAATQASFTGNGSANLSPKSSGQATAGVMPILTPTWSLKKIRNLNAQVYLFYVGSTATTESIRARVSRFAQTAYTTTVNTTTDVFTSTGAGIANGDEVTFTTTGTIYGGMSEDTRYYARDVSGSTYKIESTVGGGAIDITTAGTGTLSVYKVVGDWPNFNPEPCRYSLTGQQVSAQASADINAGVSASGPAGARTSTSELYESGTSFSRDSSLTNRTEDFPECIHPAITATDGGLGTVASNILSYTKTATATASVGIPNLLIDASTIVAAATNAPSATTMVATGTVFPSTLATTSGVTAIPTSGLRFKDVNLQSTELGQNYLAVTLIDFAQFA